MASDFVYYANSIVTVPDINYYYYRNPNSTVNSKAQKHYKQLKLDKNIAKKSVLDFLKEKNAQIRDRDFWATKYEFSFCGITLYRLEESFSTEKILLFGLKIFEKTKKDIQ